MSELRLSIESKFQCKLKSSQNVSLVGCSAILNSKTAVSGLVISFSLSGHVGI